eukprot:CAMPEP_0197031762 /NCGR_PEP_ID=MMETSP1384-20130603/10657_1 /TAXON_ID=29189 /ORGANISM="Ammonia sp." /LENGTH=301 /DNA_ID=CAMNT_0042461333 /DNA_START=50 /DNA_END=955 /DNA_ORIENTATION=-
MAAEDEDLKENDTPIEQQIVDAIYDDDIDKLQMLLLEDADLNKLAAYGRKGNEKITPLFIAASKKNLKACKLLIKFKADVNVKSFPNGNTPLHIAAMWAQHKIVALFLKNGANPVANNNKNKNPLQIIGSKYGRNQMSDEVMTGKMETQILLLEAGGNKADNFQAEIDEDLADAEDGLAGLKNEANTRIKKIQQQNNKQFDSTHPYLYVKSNRMKAWKQKNRCTVQEYLHKRYIKVKVPQWEDKENQVTHIDLSKVASFQLAIAKELLTSSGLHLLPEHQPELPKNAKFEKEKASKKKANK